MSNYRIETQINTSQHLLMLGDGIAEEFDLGGFKFKIAVKDFDKRAGVRYFVCCSIEALNYREAYNIFMEKIMRTADSMAFFYSQPVSVEYWNNLITKEGDRSAYFSGHKLRPTTSLRDYSTISDELSRIIDAVNSDEELYNIVWLYNNNAKLDGVDFDPGSRQFALCQLVESLAEKEEVSGCKTCNRRAYTRTSRKDIENMIGKSLYKKLYGGSDALRNRLAHGSLTGGTFLEDRDVEDIILKISDRINDKYDLRNKVTQSTQDRIRSTHTWNGGAITVHHEQKGLEEFLEMLDKHTLRPVRPLLSGW